MRTAAGSLSPVRLSCCPPRPAQRNKVGQVFFCLFRGEGEHGTPAAELRAEHARLQSSETELRAEHANAMQVQYEGAVVEDRARPPSPSTGHLACVAEKRATANVLLYFCSSDGEKIPVEIAGTHSFSARHAPDAVW